MEICEKILDEEVASFEQWLDSTKLNRLIEQMFKDARDLRECRAFSAYTRKCPDLSDEQPQGRRATGRSSRRQVHAPMRKRHCDATTAGSESVAGAPAAEAVKK